MENIQISIGTFEDEVKRMGHIIEQLRTFKKIIMFDRSNKTFYRYRINPTEKRLYWMQEASLDQRNWITQHEYFSLKDVLKCVYNNKIKNNIND
jgi:hypothetical protein